MTDNSEAATTEVTEPQDKAVLVDRACQGMTDLLDVLNELVGNDKTPPVGTIPSERFGGPTGDAYRRRHRQLVDTAKRLRKLSLAQLARLQALHSELHDAPPSTTVEAHDLDRGIQ